MDDFHMTDSIKVLHLFESLHNGGIEMWLMNILHLRNPLLHFDFYLKSY
jgi:hypothetical protein